MRASLAQSAEQLICNQLALFPQDVAPQTLAHSRIPQLMQAGTAAGGSAAAAAGARGPGALRVGRGGGGPASFSPAIDALRSAERNSIGQAAPVSAREKTRLVRARHAPRRYPAHRNRPPTREEALDDAYGEWIAWAKKRHTRRKA